MKGCIFLKFKDQMRTRIVSNLEDEDKDKNVEEFTYHSDIQLATTALEEVIKLTKLIGSHCYKL